MTKEIILSIQPQYLKDILNGKKTLELRKSIPKNFKGWVNLYCTKGSPYLTKYENEFSTYNIPHFGNIDLNGKIVGRFWFDGYIDLSFEYIEKEVEFKKFDNSIEEIDIEKELCLTWEEIEKYNNNGKKEIYGWKIKELGIFEKPLELSDFSLKKAPQSWCYAWRV